MARKQGGCGEPEMKSGRLIRVDSSWWKSGNRNTTDKSGKRTAVPHAGGSSTQGHSVAAHERRSYNIGIHNPLPVTRRTDALTCAPANDGDDLRKYVLMDRLRRCPAAVRTLQQNLKLSRSKGKRNHLPDRDVGTECSFTDRNS